MTEKTGSVKVLWAGICSLILVMGVARFSYTPLLPLMQKNAGLSIGEGGVLAAINYAGYLLGAIATWLITDVKLKDRLFRVGLVVAVASTALMGVSTNVWVWELSRFIAGLAAAAGMLLGSGLVLNWLMLNGHRAELGVHFSGVGLGIALCAAAVELMTPRLAWSTQWYVLSLIGAILLVPAWFWMPRVQSGGSQGPQRVLEDVPPSPLFLRVFMAAYFCAGFGYVVSATFLVSIVDGLPGMAGRGTFVFLIVGLAGAPSCILWDLIARRTGHINAVILAASLQTIGIVLPIWPGGLAAALIGSILFGGTVMGLVSLVLTMAGRYFPNHPGKLIGKMSIAYGAAQIVGPAVTGWLARDLGSYASGLFIAAGVLASGVVLLFILKGLERAPVAAGTSKPAALRASAVKSP